MALFIRRQPAPGPFTDFRRFKPFLREDFRFQCAYCNISEGYRRGADVFGVDHFRPQALFRELASVYENLYYCCGGCNSIKGARFPDEQLLRAGIGFVDPCEVDPYDVDLREAEDGQLDGLTPPGRFTIEVIGLNREECRRFRMRRRRSAERIRRLRSELEGMNAADGAWRLVADALEAAELEWRECYGVFPRLGAT